ncbi:hypothetical protein BC477_18260 [Clavibacter michiganensis subsp. michiganensis]|uniref:Uncharacterized protein n=1 Tax=Clavibacter michiganensis subsp. michiganensis TaxID=33013 RepID=A0A251XG34_CLAMM|nr:hypothetical protein BC477_18260 [Clavibacter michiganensis subsp. michiganensis]OUE01426.1 hypothetical protein CMMCAS07_14045 [Clavibacter michiganensis subsp. michiganensis]
MAPRRRRCRPNSDMALEDASVIAGTSSRYAP